MTLPSNPTSKCALKCKYCGEEMPFISGMVFTGIPPSDGMEWALADNAENLDAFVSVHSQCSLAEKPGVDRQPFLLSWG